MKRAAAGKSSVFAAATAVIFAAAAAVSFAVPTALAVEPEETAVSGEDWIDGVYPVQYAAIEIDEMDAEQVSSPAAQAQTEPVSGRGTKPAPVTQQPPAIQPAPAPQLAPAPQPAPPVITDNQQENCVGDGLTY